MLGKNLNISDAFVTSKLQRFRYKHCVRFLKIVGEKLCSNPQLTEKFKQIIEEYWILKDANHIFNMKHEIRFYWKLEEVLLGCTNTSGVHELKPLIIRKSKTSRYFSNFKNSLGTRKTSGWQVKFWNLKSQNYKKSIVVTCWVYNFVEHNRVTWSCDAFAARSDRTFKISKMVSFFQGHLRAYWK